MRRERRAPRRPFTELRRPRFRGSKRENPFGGNSHPVTLNAGAGRNGSLLLVIPHQAAIDEYAQRYVAYKNIYREEPVE